ncbi:MAG: SAM-dependent methyltransferase [Treponema sp.]|nr:SAM-dependent methyltransferase [Treponema sp.]
MKYSDSEKNNYYNDVINAVISIEHSDLIKIVFTSPKNSAPKAVIKPVLLKKNKAWQCEKFIGNSAFHENVPESGLRAFLERLLDENQYRQINLITIRHVIAYRVSKKLKLSMIKSANNQTKIKIAGGYDAESKPSLNHDNEKNYLLKEGMSIKPLVDLGVFSKDYRIIKAKYYKFKQINNFLKNIVSAMEHNTIDALNIVEFGCGKSYLTFILYYYFKYIKKINVSVTGYDKEAYVVDLCNNVAQKYQYENLKFIQGDVSHLRTFGSAQCSQLTPNEHHDNIDMIVTLHACDTATDYALHYAIKNKIKYIFCVPCCQQEINAQIKRAEENSSAAFAALLRYGLYKERFSALLTDCIRCEVLNDNGYYVDAVEFIGEENTPKNAMIRARYTGHKKNYSDEISKLTSLFGIEHKLVKLIEND